MHLNFMCLNPQIQQQTIEMKFNQKGKHQSLNQRKHTHSQFIQCTKNAEKATSNLEQHPNSQVIQFEEVYFEDKIQDSDSDVSLDDDILDQHLTVLNEKIENYYFYSSQLYKSKASLQGIQQTLKINTIEQYLTEIAKTFSPHLHNLLGSLLAYLQKQAEFRSFISHIYYCFSTRVSMEIIELVFAVWSVYLPYLKMNLSLEEVQQVTLLITKRICQKEKMNVNQSQYENCSEGKGGISKHRLYFVITTTTIFVLEKIFKNPFFSSTRQSAETQHQVEVRQLERRRKLVKFQRQS